jgi:DNA invertase Pin-like site-specific DNA recombinase
MPTDHSELPQRKLKRTPQDVEADLELLRPQSDQIKALERKLKRERAGMIGGKASGHARAPKHAEQARRRWEELGAARGSAGVIMRELLCSRSTLYRWLEMGRPSDRPST